VVLLGKVHAMRPSGPTNAFGRRLTLCGLHARPMPMRTAAGLPPSCRTCTRVARLRPPGRPANISADLALLREALDIAAVDWAHSRHGSAPAQRLGGGDVPERDRHGIDSNSATNAGRPRCGPPPPAEIILERLLRLA
jgi:hypothetical protein